MHSVGSLKSQELLSLKERMTRLDSDLSIKHNRLSKQVTASINLEHFARPRSRLERGCW
jgi:hypothetical protein